MTARELASEVCKTLAIFLCTKTSPGLRPRTVVSGTRESEHPSHRIFGDWPFARVGRSSGCDSPTLCDQFLLDRSALWNASV